jgi:hypothetical protein
VFFNAAIPVWPMVGLNVTLTAINGFYIFKLMRGRHDPRNYEVVEVLPTEGYLRQLLHSFNSERVNQQQAEQALETGSPLQILGAEGMGQQLFEPVASHPSLLLDDDLTAAELA